MDGTVAIVGLLALAALVGIGGVWLGMLVAPRVDRRVSRDDEEEPQP
jgi:hypothetical protein